MNDPKFEVKSVVSYIDTESSPENQLYFFSYRIQIFNQGSVPCTLLSRHWFITDGQGHTEEVKGAGVVGLQPQIMPGAFFEYESACPLPTPVGTMKGTYQMRSAAGEDFTVSIPEFYLVAPNALH